VSRVTAPHLTLGQENAVPETHSRKAAAESADDQRRAIQAVQVALDRRDNGGDAAAPGDGMPATSR
jgi:hypothetical protein